MELLVPQLDQTLARNYSFSALICEPCVIGFRTALEWSFCWKSFISDMTQATRLSRRQTFPWLCDEMKISTWLWVSAMSAPGLQASSWTAVNRAAPRACGVAGAPHPTHPLGRQIETPSTPRVLTNPIFPRADSVVTNGQTNSKLSRLRLAYVIVIAAAVWRCSTARHQDVASSHSSHIQSHRSQSANFHRVHGRNCGPKTGRGLNKKSGYMPRAILLNNSVKSDFVIWTEGCLRFTLAQCVPGTTHFLSADNRKRRRFILNEYLIFGVEFLHSQKLCISEDYPKQWHISSKQWPTADRGGVGSLSVLISAENCFDARSRHTSVVFTTAHQPASSRPRRFLWYTGDKRQHTTGALLWFRKSHGLSLNRLAQIGHLLSQF